MPKLWAIAFLLLNSTCQLGCQRGEIERPGEYRPEDNTPFAETPVGKHGRLQLDGLQIVDEEGTAVQLRGVSSQWLNWETTGYAKSYAGLMWMRDNWNISLIRAAMGVGDGQAKPASEGYLLSSEAMLTRVEKIVANATELGVYVIIDWHDHYAQLHQDEAEDFFRQMARKYKSHDNVLFEIYNEPMTLAQPRLDLPELTWSDDIKPYHEDVVEVIRGEGNDSLIILGTPRWSQEIDKAAADPLEGDNLLYTLHFYACSHDQWLRDLGDIGLAKGLPLFVTEWGATDASGGTNDKTVCVDEAERWHTWMNENGISWAAWKLDDCTEASCLLRTGTPVDGPYDDALQGHGAYVVDKLLGRTVLPAEDGGIVSTDAGTPDAASDASAL